LLLAVTAVHPLSLVGSILPHDFFFNIFSFLCFYLGTLNSFNRDFKIFYS
jgi:hypothetical protein